MHVDEEDGVRKGKIGLRLRRYSRLGCHSSAIRVPKATNGVGLRTTQ